MINLKWCIHSSTNILAQETLDRENKFYCYQPLRLLMFFFLFSLFFFLPFAIFLSIIVVEHLQVDVIIIVFNEKLLYHCYILTFTLKIKFGSRILNKN